MAQHKHGEMDSTTQQRTFEGFMRFTARTAIVIVVALILLAVYNA